MKLNLAAMMLLAAAAPPPPTARDPRPLDRVPVYGRNPKPAPKRKRKPGQTVAEADERIRAAEAKRQRKIAARTIADLPPRARIYAALLLQWVASGGDDEVLHARMDRAWCAMDDADIEAVNAWAVVLP